MSRSKKKNPGGSVTCAGATAGRQHRFKKQESRAKRRAINSLIKIGDTDILPHDREFGNEWASPRDGKQWWNDHDDKWMRK